MKSSAKKVELAPYDDLFSTEESRQDAKLEKVREIPLSELHPFKNHPFKVKDDEAIDMKQSTNLRTTAKELVVPERRFVRFLLEQRFVYRTASGNVLPYAKPSNDGLFCVKDYCNHGHIGSYTLVTPQGKLYFAQLRDSILLMI